MADPIRIEGLSQFQRALKRRDKEAAKGLRHAFNNAAERIVAEARPRVPRRTGRARASVKARSTQTAARVVGGSKAVPYYPWLDFGGRVGRGHSIARPFLKEGRFIYAAYHANLNRFRGDLESELTEVIRKSGLEAD